MLGAAIYLSVSYVPAVAVCVVESEAFAFVWWKLEIDHFFHFPFEFLLSPFLHSSNRSAMLSMQRAISASAMTASAARFMSQAAGKRLVVPIELVSDTL